MAKELGETAPAFYTQSDLTKLKGAPAVMVLGINPGSEGTYADMKSNPNWELNGQDITGAKLLKGNCCLVDGKPAWEGRTKWRYWGGLKSYFSQCSGVNPLDDEERLVVTNMSFFCSKEADKLAADLLVKSMPQTLSLIETVKPAHLLFLSGKAMLERLEKLNRGKDLFKLDYEMVENGVYRGTFNGIPFMGVPHPNAWASALPPELRAKIATLIAEFMA